jgi:hypothetical protein
MAMAGVYSGLVGRARKEEPLFVNKKPPRGRSQKSSAYFLT